MVLGVHPILIALAVAIKLESLPENYRRRLPHYPLPVMN